MTRRKQSRKPTQAANRDLTGEDTYAQREYGVTEEQLDRFVSACEAEIEHYRASGELEKYRFTPKQIRQKIAEVSVGRLSKSRSTATSH